MVNAIIPRALPISYRVTRTADADGTSSGHVQESFPASRQIRIEYVGTLSGDVCKLEFCLTASLPAQVVHIRVFVGMHLCFKGGRGFCLCCSRFGLLLLL